MGQRCWQRSKPGTDHGLLAKHFQKDGNINPSKSIGSHLVRTSVVPVTVVPSSQKHLINQGRLHYAKTTSYCVT